MKNIYIVRWYNPDPSICLVTAKNEKDALEMMDQIADPLYCRVQKYEGPICISFDLRLKSHTTEIKIAGNAEYHTVVDDVADCLDEIPLEADIDGNFDEGYDMKHAIIKVAFPNYAAYMDGFDIREYPLDKVTPEDEVNYKKALQQDFDDIEKDVFTTLYPLDYQASSDTK